MPAEELYAFDHHFHPSVSSISLIILITIITIIMITLIAMLIVGLDSLPGQLSHLYLLAAIK
jgi:hypothetical protein